MRLQVKGSQNVSFDIEFNGPETTILQLKEKIAALRQLEASKIRLIYSGKILVDNQTVANYNIPDGHAIHMVVTGVKPAPKPADAAAQPAPAQPAPSAIPSNPLPNVQAPPQPNPFAAGGNPFAGFMGGAGNNPFGVDPSQISAMMNNPMVQQMMDQMTQNPEMFRQMLENNPMVANNPAMRSQVEMILNNPEMLRQGMEMMRQFSGGGAGANPGAGAGAGAGAQNPYNPFGFDFNAIMQNPEYQRLMNDPQAMQDAMRMLSEGPLAGFGGLGNPFGGAAPSAPATSTSAPSNDELKVFYELTGITESDEIKQKLSTANSSKAMHQFIEACRALRKEGVNVFPSVQDLGQPAAPAAAAAAAPAPAPAVSNEERFRSQLQTMNEMGLNDNEKNIRALLASNGNVNVAIERIFNGM